MVQQKKQQKTWLGVNVQGKTSPARIIFHTRDSIWRLPMLQGSSIDHKQLGMIVLPKIFPMYRERFATRSLLSGRRSNRFHLDSNLSHRNDHVTMTQPPASIQGGGPRYCQLFQDQLQGVPEPWKQQRCYSSTSAAETSSRTGSAWISPGLPPVVANSNARKCPSCIGNLQLAKF